MDAENAKPESLEETVARQADLIKELQAENRRLKNMLNESRVYHLKSTASLQKQVRDLLELVETLKTPDPKDEILLVREKFLEYQEQLAAKDEKILSLQKEARECAEINFKTNLRLTKEIEALKERLGERDES
ncbi:MAG: hypothetical protein ACTSU5_08120 [Promethearchaeota archaeon]